MTAPVAEEHVGVVDEAGAELSWVAPQRLLDACEALRHLFPKATGDHGQVADGLHATAASLLTFLVWRSRVARQPRHHEIIHQLRTFLLSHTAYLPTTEREKVERERRRKDVISKTSHQTNIERIGRPGEHWIQNEGTRILRAKFFVGL